MALHRLLKINFNLTVRQFTLYATWMRLGFLTALVIFLQPVAALATGTGDELDRFLLGKGFLNASADPTNNLSARSSELVVAAMGALGLPYRTGGNTFDNGFDCSGFVHAIFERTVGMTLPRNAAQQAAVTQPIEPADLQPGDLVFFNTLRKTFSHVGIYVGNNKFIHSPKPGAAVRIEDLTTSYWRPRFDGARRAMLGEPAPLGVGLGASATSASRANLWQSP